MDSPELHRWKSDLPVFSIALRGMQTASAVPPGIWAWVNVVPDSMSLSRFGVIICLFPSARMVSNRWSSVNKNKILGFFYAFLKILFLLFFPFFCLRIILFYYFCRYSGCNTVWWYIFGYYSIASDYRMFADSDIRQNADAVAYPDFIFNDYRTGQLQGLLHYRQVDIFETMKIVGNIDPFRDNDMVSDFHISTGDNMRETPDMYVVSNLKLRRKGIIGIIFYTINPTIFGYPGIIAYMQIFYAKTPERWEYKRFFPERTDTAAQQESINCYLPASPAIPEPYEVKHNDCSFILKLFSVLVNGIISCP
jgi:hypothetical protein